MQDSIGAGGADSAAAGISDTGSVVVYVAPDAISAEVIRGTLHAEGIEAFVGEQVTGAYSGPLSVGEGGWGEVRVHSSDAPRAAQIIAHYETTTQPLTDNELEAEALASSDPEV